MKIITLIENVVNSPKLVAEHGLSLYIETANRKILFDTGQSALFMQNAQELNIDLREIDSVILSHGHYDHTGGLYPFLKINSKAKVYAKKDIFKPKYHGHNRFIGTIQNELLLKDRIIYVSDITEIDEHVYIMPNIQIYNATDTHFKGLNIKVNKEFIPDVFDDELFLTIKQNDQIKIITACSHKGITNICTTATDQFKLPVDLILGGFHMKECNIEQYITITHYFRTRKPKAIGVCHCTGLEKFADLRRECETHLFYNYTGNVIDFK
jgi:7,8-dihydropterin-6-yl-methyl-4-(beta-D-ribofuranosyl)aminobenzene 5'-phosphate synthase